MRNLFLIFAMTFLVTTESISAQETKSEPGQKSVQQQKQEDRPGDSPEAQIKAEMKRIAIEFKMPSMFAGYRTLGKPLVASSGGTRKSKSGIKVTLEDKVHLGSCTKAMTATMLARLIERGKLKNGKLSWDTTIEEGLPELVKDLHPSYAKVTLRQLLMHRGGCPHDTNWLAVSKSDLTESRRSLVRIGLRKTHENKPGEHMYSNLGYVVAGLMATKATGKTWEVLMKEEIFRPLGLKSAGFGPPSTKGKIDQPIGHVAMGPLLVPMRGDNPPALGPAGTVHMSLADWSTFCLSHALTDDDQTPAARKLRLVTQNTLDFMHKPLESVADDGKNYALGWMVLERKWGGRVIGHSGSNVRWLCTVYVSPKNKSVYLAATNCVSEEVGKGLDQIFSTLIRLEKEARGKKAKDD